MSELKVGVYAKVERGNKSRTAKHVGWRRREREMRTGEHFGPASMFREQKKAQFP